MPIIEHLVVDGYGTHIGKYSERLKVTKKGKLLEQAPLLHLETVTVANQGVSISAEAIRVCSERGIPIHFVSGTGTAYASLYSAGLTGTIQTRRSQLLAYHDERSVQLALALAIGKVQNQAQLLKYLGKYRKQTQPEVYKQLQYAITELDSQRLKLTELQAKGYETIDALRPTLMGTEGYASRCYWQALQPVVPKDIKWKGREGRGARDPFNMALNYGYGILYGQVERALVLAGLDPFAGFVHVDRPGKPSLVLDVVEEFRQATVDRTVIAMLTKGTDIAQDERGMLTKETRQTLAKRFFKRLDTPAKFEGKHYPLRAIIQLQARHIATFLRGERGVYTPFVASW